MGFMTTTTKVINEVVTALVKEAGPERIILFGSHATGAVTPDSDLDLLIVETKRFDEKNSRRKELSRLSKSIASFRIPIDILLYSHEEVERWKHSINHVVARAIREGKVVYERP